MKKIIIGFVCIIGVVLVAAVAISYSWTFTPIGRLDYPAAIIAKLSEWNHAPLALDDESIRAGDIATAKLIGIEKSSEGLTQHDVMIPGDGGDIPLRIYIPEGQGPFPAMVNFHGGGFFAGGNFVFDAVPMEFARRARVVVFSIDYRLAPKHPFPAAIDDCYRATQWIAANAEKYGAIAQPLAVMGQSAGGNLAAAVALRARDENGPAIAFQYLEVPVVDQTQQHTWPSMREFGDKYMLKTSMMSAIADAYLPDPNNRSNPYASPLLVQDHSRLPPALIVVAQFDPLRDQGIAYAKALEKQGVSVQLDVAQGVLHGFMGSPKQALKNIDRIKIAMEQAFSRYGVAHPMTTHP